MKTIYMVICALVLFAFLPCLTAEQKNNIEAPSLIWRDTETKQVLFTLNDVISFDWDKQVFLLKRYAILNFLAWTPPHIHQARKLVVEDTNGPIYEAHWVSGKSSMGFSGPVYTPLSPNPFFSISNRYPSGRDSIARSRDTRFAPRLKAGLEKAGVLHSINLDRNYVGLIIQTTGHTWKEVGEDMKVRVEYFENTFRLGRKARAHVFFAGGEKSRKQIDSLAFMIRFVANKGTFRSDLKIEGVPAFKIEDGIYACRFAPWQPVEGSDEEPELGTGIISLTILFKKQDKTLYRLDFPESYVPIGGRTEAEYDKLPDNK